MYQFSDHTVTRIIILIFCLLIIGDIMIEFVTNEYHITVTDKQIKANSDDYLIFCELSTGETKVFSLNDSIIHWNFDTSDDFGRLQVGKKYTVRTSGIRFPLLSMYENIYEIR